MRNLRRFGLTLVIMMLMLLPMATSAYADGSDAAEGFAYWVWQYLGM